VTEFHTVADRLDSLFAAIDANDIESFLGFLAPTARFRFGSAPAVTGHTAIREAVGGFFASISGCQHRISTVLQQYSTLVCEGEVTYHRHDGTQLTLPFTNVFELDGDQIADYKIYIDIAPLWAG
jgi:limonene-1,2-epoxide hydrolase